MDICYITIWIYLYTYIEMYIYIYLSWNISINIHMGQSPKALNQKCVAVFNQRLALTTSLPTNQQLAGRKFIKHKQLKKNTWCFFNPSFKLSCLNSYFSKGHHWLKCMENSHRSSFSFNGRKKRRRPIQSELQTCQSLGRVVLVAMSLGHGEKSGKTNRLIHVEQLLKYRELMGS